jgi:hypothetical protein
VLSCVGLHCTYGEVEVEIFAESIFSLQSDGRKLQSTLNACEGLLHRAILWKIEEVLDHFTADTSSRHLLFLEVV